MRQTVTENRLFSKKDLRKLIIPLILEQTLAITVGMADTMMIYSAGEAAVSGVSLVDMFNNLIISVLAALATGGAVVTSQCIGAGGLHADLPRVLHSIHLPLKHVMPHTLSVHFLSIFALSPCYCLQ